MRYAILLAALACTSAKVAAPVEMRILAAGSYATVETRQAVLAKSDADYRAQWQKLIGEAQPPDVDFEQNVVVFLMAGMRNTGGWQVLPAGVTIEGDTAVIDAKVQGPPPGGIATQAITYPYAVVSINQRAVEKVRWD